MADTQHIKQIAEAAMEAQPLYQKSSVMKGMRPARALTSIASLRPPSLIVMGSYEGAQDTKASNLFL